MTTVEMIWGRDALKELTKPHRDPRVRTIENKLKEFQRLYYGAPQALKMRDNLPAHYRKIKI